MFRIPAGRSRRRMFMGVSRNQDNKIVMNGWRGLNESFAPAHLRPGDLAAVKNMDLRDGIALTSRLGQTSEHDREYYPNNQPVRRILRYKSSMGVKKRLVLFGNNLRADTNDNKKYDDVVTIPGTPWMLQYYDIVLFGSDQQDMGVYDPIAGTVVYPTLTNVMDYHFWDTAVTTSTTDGCLPDGYYAYRFTYSISAGGVFLGETGPLRGDDGRGINLFTYALASFSSGSNTNSVNFKKRDLTVANGIPPYVVAINIYRSPTLTASKLTDPGVEWPALDDYSLEWAGSIEMDAFRAAAAGDTMFTDLGVVFGEVIRRQPLIYPPRSKRVAMHKGRLCVSSPRTRQNDSSVYEYAPDQVAFSDVGRLKGAEPLTFFPESTFAVGAGEPDEMTVLKSIRGQVLGVCKEDKTYAVLGMDDEIVEGFPNLSVQLIDGFTGCDAPDSCVDVDGGAIMFKSERGVMIWQGSGPEPVKYQDVKKTLARIPAARKSKAVGSYNSKEREYDLFITIPDGTGGSSTYNRSYLRFNFNNGGWTSGRLPRGVSATCSVNDADAEGHILWGIDDIPLTTFASTPWVMKSDSGFKEGIDANPAGTEKISFEMDSGYQDGGAPWLRKQWKEIALEFESQVPVSIAVWVDNQGPFTQTAVSPPVDEDTLVWGDGAWGEKKWGRSLTFGTSRRVLTRSLATLPKGQSIRVILSGTNIYDPMRLYSATVYYTPEES